MRTILVTGFGPFGRWIENPSGRIAEMLHGRRIGAAHVAGVVLPVVYETAGPRLLAALSDVRPAAVLCLGLGGGTEIRVERVAINLDDSGPDNAGEARQDRPIVPGGPAAYFSTLPVREIVQALQAREVPASLSNSAGTFLCNHVMYVALHARSAPAGFLHLPPAPEGMPFEAEVRGVEEVVGLLGGSVGA